MKGLYTKPIMAIYGPAADFTLEDPALPHLFIGIETDTLKFKIGDGVTNWSSLSYVASLPTHTHAALYAALSHTHAGGDLTTLLVPGGTPVNAVASSGTLTSDGTAPSDGDAVTIGGKTYTFKTALTPTEGEVLIGASAAAALDNLKSAVNHEGTPDTDYSCAEAHPDVEATTNTDTTQVFVAKVKGVAGDLIKTEESSDHLSFGAENLENGVDGTPGGAGEALYDGSYLYLAVAVNTIADANWRRFSVGSVY